MWESYSAENWNYHNGELLFWGLNYQVIHISQRIQEHADASTPAHQLKCYCKAKCHLYDADYRIKHTYSCFQLKLDVLVWIWWCENKRKQQPRHYTSSALSSRFIYLFIYFSICLANSVPCHFSLLLPHTFSVQVITLPLPPQLSPSLLHIVISSYSTETP